MALHPSTLVRERGLLQGVRLQLHEGILERGIHCYELIFNNKIILGQFKDVHIIIIIEFSFIYFWELRQQ